MRNEGTENRIAVARNDDIKAVQTCNVNVRSLPSNLTAMAFGYKTNVNFTVDDENAIANRANVDFRKIPAKPPGEAAGVPK